MIEGKRKGLQQRTSLLNEHEFEQTQGENEGQERLACCSPWGHTVRDDSATDQKQQYF